MPTGTFLVHYNDTTFGKLSERFSLLWSRGPGTNGYAASASTSWLLEKAAVFSSPPAQVTFCQRLSYHTPAVSCAPISVMTSHSPAPLCELIREPCLGLCCPAVNCDSHRSEPPLLSLPLLQIAATFTRWTGHAAKEINNSQVSQLEPEPQLRWVSIAPAVPATGLALFLPLQTACQSTKESLPSAWHY